jgi:winged helix DNA-binding protein
VDVRTLDDAAAWVDRVGLALVFPKDDLVLPSLWHAAGGGEEFALREPDGTFVQWTEPMAFVWRTKDELPAQRLACAGKHLRGRASVVALDVLPALVAATERDVEPSPVEEDVFEVVRGTGPVSTRELPELLPHRTRREVRAAVERLQRRLVLTNAGLEETDGWPAILVDLVDRRYADRLGDVPPAEEARHLLARRLLETAGELSAADLSAALGWRRKLSESVLEGLGAERREADGYSLWLSDRARGSRG